MEQIERNRRIARAYFLGHRTLQSLADEHGITKERVRQIVQRHIQRQPAGALPASSTAEGPDVPQR